MSMPEGPGQPGYPPPPDQPGGQPGYPPPASPPPPGPTTPDWTPPAGPQGYYPKPGDPGYAAPPPKQGRRFNWVALVVFGVIIAAIVGGLAFFRDRLPDAAAALQVGDCIDLPTSETTFTDVQHQPCNLAHDAEVILVFTHPAPPGDAYPVISGFDDIALERCVPAFESYVGRDYETDPDLEIGYFHPTISGWGEGDRGFTCHTKRIDDTKLIGTIRVGGAPASP